jgi:hypothetical protein
VNKFHRIEILQAHFEKAPSSSHPRTYLQDSNYFIISRILRQ